MCVCLVSSYRFGRQLGWINRYASTSPWCHHMWYLRRFRGVYIIIVNSMIKPFSCWCLHETAYQMQLTLWKMSKVQIRLPCLRMISIFHYNNNHFIINFRYFTFESKGKLLHIKTILLSEVFYNIIKENSLTMVITNLICYLLIYNKHSFFKS